MLRFQVNNNLKAEPVVFGLRIGNIIYLVMIGVVGLVLYGVSGHVGLSKTAAGIFSIVLVISAYIFLKRMERNPDYGYMDKFLARLFQPKFIDASDMKKVLEKRNRDEIRRY